MQRKALRIYGLLLILTWQTWNLILNCCDKFLLDAALAVISFFNNRSLKLAKDLKRSFWTSLLQLKSAAIILHKFLEILPSFLAVWNFRVTFRKEKAWSIIFLIFLYSLALKGCFCLIGAWRDAETQVVSELSAVERRNMMVMAGDSKTNGLFFGKEYLWCAFN